MSELPKGWIEAPFMDVFDIQGGTQPPKSVFKYDLQNGYVRLLQIRDFGDKPLPTYIPVKNTLKRCAKDDVLIGRYGASVGRICTGMEGAYNVALAKVIIPEGFDKKFVTYLLRSEFFQRPILDIERSAQNGFNKEDLSEITLPIPPANEQRCIVAKLEMLLSRVYAAQARLATILHVLKRFRQSVLNAASSGRLTADWRTESPNVGDASPLVAKLESAHQAAGGHKRGNAAPPTDEAHDLDLDDLPTSWRMTDLRTAVCPDRPITYGILKPGPNFPGGISYVRVADFPNDRLNLETIRRTTKEIEKVFGRARLRQGDILLSIRGTVGRVCVVPAELQNANITQDTARLSIQPSIDSTYVLWFLRAGTTQKRMQKAVKGVAVRGINIGDVRALQLPLPTLAEQQEIVRRVEALFRTADALEGRYRTAKAHVDKLAQSILAKAFRGELVPQDPDDEPASVLLGRVRNGRLLTHEREAR